MILAIAKAINELDIETLITCRRANSEWMQSTDERDAMDALIDAALEAVQEIN